MNPSKVLTLQQVRVLTGHNVKPEHLIAAGVHADIQSKGMNRFYLLSECDVATLNEWYRKKAKDAEQLRKAMPHHQAKKERETEEAEVNASALDHPLVKDRALLDTVCWPDVVPIIFREMEEEK